MPSGDRVVSSTGWSGGEPPIGAAGQLPALLMHRSMVGAADQGQVGQVGGAAIDPVPQMMGLAPGQGAGTVGEDTAAVADSQGGALSRLYTTANAQGRNVGFRCVVHADSSSGAALATRRDPEPPRR